MTMTIDNITVEGTLQTSLTNVDSHNTRHQPGGSDAISTSAASSLTPDQSNAEGVATSLSRSDHIHNIATAAPSSSSTSSTNTQGSASSFSKSDHIHNIQVARSSAATSATATRTTNTYALLTSMSVTPGAGTWIVMFSGAISHTTNNATIEITIYVNGVEDTTAHRLWSCSSGTNDRGVLTTMAVSTVAAAQTIEVWWKTSGATATFADRTLIAFRVA